MSDSIYDLIPRRLRPGIYRYLMDGILPGHFLQACLRGDLNEVVARGDDESLAAIKPLMMLLWNKFPSNAHGNSGKVLEWHNVGGWNGKYAEEQGPTAWDWDLSEHWPTEGP